LYHALPTPVLRLDTVAFYLRAARLHCVCCVYLLRFAVLDVGSLCGSLLPSTVRTRGLPFCPFTNAGYTACGYARRTYVYRTVTAASAFAACTRCTGYSIVLPRYARVYAVGFTVPAHTVPFLRCYCHFWLRLPALLVLRLPHLYFTPHSCVRGLHTHAHAVPRFFGSYYWLGYHFCAGFYCTLHHTGSV